MAWRDGVEGWLELLAMQVGADWKLDSLRIEAFSRSSGTVRYGVVSDSAAGPGGCRPGSTGAARRFGQGGPDALQTVDVAGDSYMPPSLNEVIEDFGRSDGNGRCRGRWRKRQPGGGAQPADTCRKLARRGRDRECLPSSR
jgi:hypothetical protein